MSNETRKLPTRPGWWWATYKQGRPAVARVGHEDGITRLYTEWLEGVYVADDPAFEYLAPIPGPEVCAALAEYSGMLLAGWDGLDFWSERLEDLQDDLADAIRAERDGAA